MYARALLLLLPACTALRHARQHVRTAPPAQVQAALGTPGTSPPSATAADETYARAADRAVAAAALLGGSSTCLARALALRSLLRRRHIASTLYLGAASADDAMTAHAWVRVGNAWLTGSAQRHRYAALISFT